MKTQNCLRPGLVVLWYQVSSLLQDVVLFTALPDNAQVDLPLVLTEKNRSGPQRLKFPPGCPNDFSLELNPEPRFAR